MASPASNPGMGTFKVITCCGMVELILSESHDFEFSSMMITVAGDAIPAFKVSGRMKALVLGNLGFQFCMTSQAFFISHLVSQRMALGTV